MRGCRGYRTIYVERASENETEPDDAKDLAVLEKEFDLVIRDTPGSEDGGLVELAKVLGIDVGVAVTSKFV